MSIARAPAVRVQLMHPYLDYLRRAEIDPAPLLSKHNLQRASLADPLDRIPLHKFLAFTHEAAAATGDLHIGLRIGTRKKAEDSALGLLFFCVDTLRQALESYVESASALIEGAQIALSPAGPNWAWSYRLDDIDPQLSRHDVESTYVSLITRIRGRMGKSWQPIALHFEHAAVGRSRSIYEQVFQAPALFDQPVNQIVISAPDLDRRTRFDRSAMLQVLQEHLGSLRLDMAEPRTMSNRVALAVARHLGHADCSLVSIAREFNISPRSLQRYLSNEGESFQQIVRRERHRAAQALIRQETQTTMASIATRLGYADESTLSRAFKSWTGTPPGRYARVMRKARATSSSTRGQAAGEGLLPAIKDVTGIDK